MFTNRLYCDDKKIRYVIVRHEQLRTEEIYPCMQGVAYPRIYTDDAVILFQDANQRRYASTVDYNIKKLFDERELIDKVLAFDIEEPGLVLHCSENTEASQDNLKAFQRIRIQRNSQTNTRELSERNYFLTIQNISKMM